MVQRRATLTSAFLLLSPSLTCGVLTWRYAPKAAATLQLAPRSGPGRGNELYRVKSSQVKSIKAHVLGDTPSCVLLGPGLMLISADSLPVCRGFLSDKNQKPGALEGNFWFPL
jgi:hypothetical protein